MRKGEKITHKELLELGYKHCMNYGNWEVWAKDSQLNRVYVDIETRVIQILLNCGQTMEEI